MRRIRRYTSRGEYGPDPASNSPGVSRSPELARDDGDGRPTIRPFGFNTAISGLNPGVHIFWAYAINAAGNGANPLMRTLQATVS